MFEFKKISGYRCPDTIVFPGASSTGCGSYIFKSQSSVFHSLWNDEKKVKSSIFRELRAVERTVVNLKIVLLNVFSNSQNCVRIISAGKFELLQQEA